MHITSSNSATHATGHHPRLRMRNAHLLSLLILTLAACSEKEKPIGSGAAPPDAAVDDTTFQVTWKPDTVVLDETTVQSNLLNPNATDGVYQFRPSLAQILDLIPGQVLVLSGVDLVKVVAVDIQTDTIIVSTTPASLVEAATDADVSWDIGAELSKPWNTTSPQSLTRLQASPTTTCDLLADSGTCIPKTTFSGKLGNLDASQTITLNADGSLTMKLLIKYPQQGGAVLSVASTAVLKSFRQLGELKIESGNLVTGSIRLEGLDLDLDLNVGAVAMGVSDNTFKYPIDVSFPFALGPLPAYVTVGVSLALNPSLSSNSAASARAHYHYTGSIGLKLEGTNISSMGALTSVNSSLPSVTGTETVSTVDAGFGVLMQFPKVTFGIGVAKVAASEAYLTCKEEIVINEKMRLDGLGLIAGNCTTVDANVGAYAGGTLRLFGKSLTQEQQIFGQTRKVVKAGNPDMTMCD